MLRRTNRWLISYALRERARSLMRKALGFAIFLSGFAVMGGYLVRRAFGVH
jgi:predicted nucleotidyltransferase